MTSMTVEQFLTRSLMQDLYLPLGLFLGVGLVFGVLEHVKPLPTTNTPRKNWRIDLIGAAVAGIASGIGIHATTEFAVHFLPWRPHADFAPSWLRLILYLIISDLGRYVFHVAMHKSEFLWAAHRFHHSPQALYWLSGVRSSVVNAILFVIPMAFAAWLLSIGPVGIAINLVLGAVTTSLVHTSYDLPVGIQKSMEWLFTTPRYHRIHHSTADEHRDTNFASMFTVWDRMLGTCVDPDKVEQRCLRFGVVKDRKCGWVRQMLGI